MSESINSLIARWVAGTLSESDRAELKHRLDADLMLRQQIEQALQRQDVSERYESYRQVDVRQARKLFFDHHPSRLHPIRKNGPLSRQLWLRAVSSVAAMALLVFAGWMLGHHNNISQRIASADHLQQQTKPLTSTFDGIFKGASSPVIPSITFSTNDTLNTGSKQANTSVIAENTSVDSIVNSHRRDIWLTLDDGTRVHLDYESTLTYPSRFGGGQRRVSLQGRAYFIVAHDNRHPFIVDTPRGTVTDYGTEFDIDTDCGNNHSVNVVLIKGSVGIRTPISSEVMLHPGERADLLSGALPQVHETDVTPYLAWNSGVYDCDHCSFDNLLLVLRRWYHVQFTGYERTMGGIYFTGLIKRDTGLDPTLRSIGRITGLQFSRQDNIVTISR